MANGLPEAVYAILTTLSKKSVASSPGESPRGRLGEIPQLRDLGIRDFFICPYDAAANQFRRPDQRLMAVKRAVQSDAYLADKGFREIQSTLRRAVHAYLETLLLDLLRRDCRAKPRTSDPGQSTIASLSSRLLTELEQLGEKHLWSQLPEGDIRPLLMDLERSLRKGFGRRVVFSSEDTYTLDPHFRHAVEGYVLFGVTRESERVAALVWDAFHTNLERMATQTSSLPEKATKQLLKNVLDYSVYKASFWQHHKSGVHWSTTSRVLLECLRSALGDASFSALASAMQQRPQSPEELLRILYSASRAYIGLEGTSKDINVALHRLDTLNQHVAERLPARAFAVKATGWGKLIILPVIVDRTLVGVLFGDMCKSERHMRNPENLRAVLTVIQAAAGPTLLLESQLLVARERAEQWLNIAAGMTHSIGGYTNTIAAYLDQVLDRTQKGSSAPPPVEPEKVALPLEGADVERLRTARRVNRYVLYYAQFMRTLARFKSVRDLGQDKGIWGSVPTADLALKSCVLQCFAEAKENHIAATNPPEEEQERIARFAVRLDGAEYAAYEGQKMSGEHTVKTILAVPRFIFTEIATNAFRYGKSPLSVRFAEAPEGYVTLVFRNALQEAAAPEPGTTPMQQAGTGLGFFVIRQFVVDFCGGTFVPEKHPDQTFSCTVSLPKDLNAALARMIQ